MFLKDNELAIISTDNGDYELQELINDRDILATMSEKQWYSLNMPERIDYRLEVDGELVGSIMLNNIRWFNHKARISIFIKLSEQNKGYAKRSLRMIVDHCFNMLNFHRLEAEIVDYNEKSIKLFESLGFKREGIMREAKYYEGKYHDIYLYGLLKD
ncbi:MAG: GNAT family N-acetyltransferase [Kosmotoga sp.]|nr:MAG: GNAT family N-acetyltransferase [Kosmotoga sp.]